MTTEFMYRSSTDSAYNPLLHQQILGCENTDINTQKSWLAHSVKPVLRSTVAAFGIARTPGVGIASTTPTNPPVASIAAQAQEKLAFAVYQFDLVSTKRDVFNFLKDHQHATSLLAAWPSISSSIFGDNLHSKLEVNLDREANKQVLTVEVHTGIEDDEALFSAEEKLFNLIEIHHLEHGLENVVLSFY
ncbi:MAG: hypothetical protein Q9M14_05365 [Mariprofundaceae bacterium]|nr:hypothetical protein [Mariprofundaceae bacterium]